MDDITLPHESSRDDDDAFFIRPVREEALKDVEDWSKKPLKDLGEPSADLGDVAVPVATASGTRPDANSWVKLQFAKFVQLVANHSFIDIVDKNADEEIIISSNLLTDLANAHDRVQERRMPVIFIAGLVIGIVLTYILVK